MLYADGFLRRLEAGLRSILDAWDLPAETTLRLLTVSENATFLAEAGGRPIVLRVHRPGYHTEAEIRSELQWITALREAGAVDTPRPIPTRDGGALGRFTDAGEERLVAAFEFMAGKEPDAGDDLVAWYRVLGSIAARLHGHSRAWTRPPGFTRKTWDFSTILGARAYWGDWRAAVGLDRQGRATLERAAEFLERQAAAYAMGADRFGLIHADMRLANLIVDGSRMGVIDFDDCGFSWFLYDFAASVSFIEAEPSVPELMAAWVEGYRAVAPLSPEDEKALPLFVMMRRMQLTAWIASHGETPTARAMGAPYTAGTVELAERFLSRG